MRVRKSFTSVIRGIFLRPVFILEPCAGLTFSIVGGAQRTALIYTPCAYFTLRSCVCVAYLNVVLRPYFWPQDFVTLFNNDEHTRGIFVP